MIKCKVLSQITWSSQIIQGKYQMLAKVTSNDKTNYPKASFLAPLLVSFHRLKCLSFF